MTSRTEKSLDDELGYGERFAVGLARYPERVLCCSLLTAVAFALVIVIALSTSPDLFQLDATEEGFKVADAPESLSWDFLEGIWTGDFSDDLPEPSLSQPPPSTSRTAATMNANRSTGRILQGGGRGGGGGGGGGGGRGGGGGISEEEQQARNEKMMEMLPEQYKPEMQKCIEMSGRELRQCQRQVLRSLPEEIRQKIRDEFGGGRGSGRQNGARGQAMGSAAGGALSTRSTSTSIGDACPQNMSNASISSSCMTFEDEASWASYHAFRPYFVDVYATKKLSEDPTYWGEEYMGYGCCGVFAKEQRTWADSFNMLSEENIMRLRQFELEIRSDKQYKEFCYQDRTPDPLGRVPPRVDYQANPDAVTCAYPFSITNFFFPSVIDFAAEDVDCKELHDAGIYCEYLDTDEEQVELGSDGNFRKVDGTQGTVPVDEITARLYTPDGKGHDLSPVGLVTDYIAYLWDSNLLDPNYRLLLDNKFSGAKPTSRGMISKMVFEKPATLRPWLRERYPELNLRSEEEWQEDFDKWLNDVYLPLLQKFAAESDTDYMAYVPSFLDTWRQEGIYQAVAWSCGAVGIVFVLLWVRMRWIFRTKSEIASGWRRSCMHFLMSFILPLGALFHVLISFPVAWTIYRFVYQQKYVGYMQFISIFIIVGIGVDDVFVMFDAWMQSGDEDWDEFDLERRMRFAWCRASKAMFITSVTDGLAFLANCVSVIAAVRLFGYMIATMVVVNYILDVTLFPAVLVLVTRWVHRRSGRSETPAASSNMNEVIGVPLPSEGTPETTGIAKLRPRGSAVETFFQDRFSPRLKKFGFLTIGVAALFVAGFAIALSQLKKSDRAFRFETFPDWFPMNRIFNMGNWEEAGDIFGERTPVQPVFFIWGAKENGIDLSKTDAHNPLDKGKPWLDTGFDFTDVKTQESIVRTCESLSEMEFTRDREVLCPLRHFKEWYTHADVKGPGTWPIDDSNEFLEYLKFFVNMPFRKDRCSVNRWGRGGYQLSGDKGIACLAYFSTGEVDRGGLAYMSVKQEYAKYFGFDGSSERVSWHKIAVNTTLSSQSASRDGRAVYDSIQSILDSEGGHAIQASKLWPQMITEEAMVKAAWQGALVSLAVAGVTLMVFTQNWILAGLCLICISSIVTITLGIMPIAGWRFGFLEAMCMVFVVGFSVDFVAHLATAYNESAHNECSMRATQALADIGISIFWGMSTTTAAGFFLIFCVMVPFSKMGIFLIWNQVVSFIFAIFPFSAALILVGPVARGKVPCPAFCRRVHKKSSKESLQSNEALQQI